MYNKILKNRVITIKPKVVDPFLVIPLVDRSSKKHIEVPAKSRKCTHLECVDLKMIMSFSKINE